VAALAEAPGDWADVYLEWREEAVWSGGERAPGLEVRRDEGVAVRLVRDGHTYLASGDELSPRVLADALRRAARAQPRTALPEPRLAAAGPAAPVDTAPLAEFHDQVFAGLRQRLLAFPLRLSVRSHRRWVQVVGSRLAAPGEEERFWSAVADTPWGQRGRLLPELSGAAAEELAETLARLFRSREAPAVAPGRMPIVLAPQATAIFLHEAVAHALEADLLEGAGKPEAALGFEMGPVQLSVLDDPRAAPLGLARETDDEGLPVVRRWLLRAGRVEQPLADACAAQAYPRLLPGAGWRGSRHLPPAPRSRFLELVPGDLPPSLLLRRAEGGLAVSEVVRGGLDPATGLVTLELAGVARIRGGAVAEPCAPCRLRGRLADLLGAVAGVGNDLMPAGAGWCAKGGQRLPVMARAASLLLAEAEISG